MKNIENILNIILLGKSFCKEVSLGRVLSKAVGLVILIIISGSMMCSLMIFALYIVHLQLLQSSVDAQTALYIMSGIVLVFMIIFTTLTLISLRNLRNLLKLNAKPRSDIGKIIDAFKDGLQNK